MLEVFNEVRLTIVPDNDNPFLQGPFRSNAREYTADTDSLRVIGEIPRDLDGLFVRNHHNQIHEPLGTYHPFDGDGMLHAMRFQDGRATYRNRFVRTTGFYAEEAAGRSLWPGMLRPDLAQRRGWGAMGAMKDNAGTDVKCHAGKLLASMSQGSEPWRLDPITLETIGPDANWARRVPDGVASHYKVDPFTGEMMFFNYPEHPPYMNYGVIDRDNQLVHYVPIELPGSRWPHDLGITQNYSILHDLPLYFDPEQLRQGQHKLIFNREQPARFGILPRRGTNAQVQMCIRDRTSTSAAPSTSRSPAASASWRTIRWPAATRTTRAWCRSTAATSARTTRTTTTRTACGDRTRPWAACCAASSARRSAATRCGPTWCSPMTSCPPM